MSPIPLILLAAILPTANPVKVKFNIKVPENTPRGADGYLTGNIPALGSWRADGLRLLRDNHGNFVAHFEAPEGEKLEFKFTLGTWDSVEKDANGGDIPNRKITVGQGASQPGDGFQNYIFRIDRWASTNATTTAPSPNPPNRKSTRTGDIRLHENFESRELANKRSLIVYLPPGYEDPANFGERYPVLYMHDGQNLFDAATSFIGVEWGADETAERLIKAKKIPPIIIVGIYNTPDRMNEYTPTRDEKRGAGGKGDLYASFIVNMVKPFIDETYRTSPKRLDTAIAGSSLGGLISLHIAVRYPSTFSRVGVISPALFWDDHEIVRRIEETPVIVAKFKSLVTRRASRGNCLPVDDPVERKIEQDSPRIWLDMGTKEGESLPTFTSALEDTRRFAAALKKAGLRENEDYKYVEVEGGLHNEAAWAARFEDFLLFLWGDKPAQHKDEKSSSLPAWFTKIPKPPTNEEDDSSEIGDPKNPPTREAAVSLLLGTNTFAGHMIRDGGDISAQVVAFQVILRDPDAAAAFRWLLQNANTAGRLYALCGLRMTDRTTFDQVVGSYRTDKSEVRAMFGCIGAPMQVKDIVEIEGKFTVNLKPNQTLEDWIKAHGYKSPVSYDITGGGWPWRFAHAGQTAPKEKKP